MFNRNSFMPKQIARIKTFNSHKELFYKAFQSHHQSEITILKFQESHWFLENNPQWLLKTFNQFLESDQQLFNVKEFIDFLLLAVERIHENILTDDLTLENCKKYDQSIREIENEGLKKIPQFAAEIQTNSISISIDNDKELYQTLYQFYQTEIKASVDNINFKALSLTETQKFPLEQKTEVIYFKVYGKKLNQMGIEQNQLLISQFELPLIEVLTSYEPNQFKEFTPQNVALELNFEDQTKNSPLKSPNIIEFKLQLFVIALKPEQKNIIFKKIHEYSEKYTLTLNQQISKQEQILNEDLLLPFQDVLTYNKIKGIVSIQEKPRETCICSTNCAIF